MGEEIAIGVLRFTFVIAGAFMLLMAIHLIQWLRRR